MLKHFPRNDEELHNHEKIISELKEDIRLKDLGKAIFPPKMPMVKTRL